MRNIALLNFILSSLVPCSHKSQSWPMQLSGERGAYRSCLECGQRRRYNLLDPENGATLANAGASHPRSATAAALFPADPIMQPGNRSD
jgi:hypothetical protein